MPTRDYITETCVEIMLRGLDKENQVPPLHRSNRGSLLLMPANSEGAINRRVCSSFLIIQRVQGIGEFAPHSSLLGGCYQLESLLLILKDSKGAGNRVVCSSFRLIQRMLSIGEFALQSE